MDQHISRLDFDEDQPLCVTMSRQRNYSCCDAVVAGLCSSGALPARPTRGRHSDPSSKLIYLPVLKSGECRQRIGHSPRCHADDAVKNVSWRSTAAAPDMAVDVCVWTPRARDGRRMLCRVRHFRNCSSSENNEFTWLTDQRLSP